ncbi:outer membrane beta-barrel protein [Thiotrichales bacterium 19S3-7]|nr:outer membrane beta-barrel protein [Thiotrichales bacterium 19S3-7]MCF6800902.1 outer membrane beta-barrel protein [Thiotrichales bacterium 19S3-11]
MKRTISLASILCGVCMVNSAQADSYPSDISPYSKSFVYQEQPYDSSFAKPLIPKVMNFTGYFLGLSAMETFFHYNVTASPQSGQFNKNSPGVSLFFGYGYEFKNGIYLGGQLNTIWYPFSQLDSNEFNQEGTGYSSGIAPIASMNLDFNPGYEVINHLLLYGIIGTGVEVYRYNYQVTSGGTTTNIIDDSTDVSLMLRLGAGIKYQFSKYFMLNLDYVYAQGSPISGSGWDGSTNRKQSFRPLEQTIELGIAVKF